MLSISAGLTSAARLVVTVPPCRSVTLPLPTPVAIVAGDTVWLSIGWPSTTNSGWLVPVRDASPRITTDAPAPGSPECVRTFTFGAFAASAATTFCGSFERRSAELSTRLIVTPSRSRVVVVPAPVTTTSPRWNGLTGSAKFWLMVAPGVSAICTERAV